ncbi:MAG TPA: hypothetical protein VFQ61_19585 [Polyangiaceae bacterium]|nr:hypothetical protein [Polyangiaceae bacterium]
MSVRQLELSELVRGQLLAGRACSRGLTVEISAIGSARFCAVGGGVYGVRPARWVRRALRPNGCAMVSLGRVVALVVPVPLAKALEHIGWQLGSR